MSDQLIASLQRAVAADPDDLPLRVHLAEVLIGARRQPEAVEHLARVLQSEPAHHEARALMRSAIGEREERAPASPAVANEKTNGGPVESTVDWTALEEDLSDVVPPRFVHPPVSAADEPEPVRGDDDATVDVELPGIRLADVGGLVEVKRRLEVAFLAPLRNPKLRAMFAKSLRGGLLLYGPPGCGKTFVARAVAGEMGAKFASLSIVEVLDMWLGRSERNLHQLFETARRNAPCVLFLDEIDAIGHRRSQMNSSGMRTLANQLLAELDGMEGNNEGVFVLAATNAPWDVDAALRRPGRLDRTVFVAPPDPEARSAILGYHLRDRPIARIDLAGLAARTEGYSGADLAHLCESAAEYAMYDSITSGQVRMIGPDDFDRALRDVRPSIGGWLATARNAASFANDNGVYDELAVYLKRHRKL